MINNSVQYCVSGFLKISSYDEDNNLINYAIVYDTNRLFKEELQALKFYTDRLWDMQGVYNNCVCYGNVKIIGELKLLGIQEQSIILRLWQFG